jgi:hypothetical protein
VELFEIFGKILVRREVGLVRVVVEREWGILMPACPIRDSPEVDTVGVGVVLEQVGDRLDQFRVEANQSTRIQDCITR